MDLESIIAAEVLKQARAAGSRYDATPGRATLLADTGLDSLGFTTLIIDLERRFGVDPFGHDGEITYPETVGELVGLYAAAGARL